MINNDTHKKERDHKHDECQINRFRCFSIPRPKMQSETRLLFEKTFGNEQNHAGTYLVSFAAVSATDFKLVESIYCSRNKFPKAVLFDITQHLSPIMQGGLRYLLHIYGDNPPPDMIERSEDLSLLPRFRCLRCKRRLLIKRTVCNSCYFWRRAELK